MMMKPSDVAAGPRKWFFNVLARMDAALVERKSAAYRARRGWTR